MDDDISGCLGCLGFIIIIVGLIIFVNSLYTTYIEYDYLIDNQEYSCMLLWISLSIVIFILTYKNIIMFIKKISITYYLPQILVKIIIICISLYITCILMCDNKGTIYVILINVVLIIFKNIYRAFKNYIK